MDDKESMLITRWFHQFIVNAGIQESDVAARSRAIRISNLICLSAVVNCVIFGVYFILLRDRLLLSACVIAGAIYSLAHFLSYLGYTIPGRLLLGDFYSWNFFEASETGYDLRKLRLLAMFAPFFQITMGFFYFLKQSVKFEAESIENLRRLEIEHTKQIQVQKMSSLGEMAGGVAHEINNPLMVIMGTTYHIKKTLAQNLKEDDPIFTKIEKIDSYGDQFDTRSLPRAL